MLKGIEEYETKIKSCEQIVDSIEECDGAEDIVRQQNQRIEVYKCRLRETKDFKVYKEIENGR